ncbi:hypothetical protein [Agromyces aerolatus]|uniref:hypothetical protein n=1 Tax=Agromyces sp. LY-1074 TaxID=3074080 RepID=UPI0028572495|nr:MULTISPECIES: hypothetical protein [unclassified Agromyces]MDR5698797.1 hypothetical protein [Agromyces sp. LY-1074]MDR5705425.1 hypothetical protein [Agromyces sp. LY-1358]
MSYEEKGTWQYLLIAVAGYVVYLVLVLPRLADTPVGDVDYAWPMLWTIVGAIVAAIVLRIVVEIVWSSEEHRGDQRDRDIARAGDRVGYAFVVAGAIGALLLSWAEADWFWVANAIYLGFVLMAVSSATVKIVAYRRGGIQ